MIPTPTSNSPAHNRAAQSSGGQQPILSLRGITKRFPLVLANQAIDLDIYPGEIHALLGENGAGKSTLMKILYGFYRADSGSICMNGKPVQIHSPTDARKFGLGMLFQDFSLIPALTVAENIALFLRDLPPVLDLAQVDRRIQELAARYNLQVRSQVKVSELSLGEQQKVEILKLLLSESKILILDEPTRVLAPHEITALYEVLSSLRRDGYGIILITHKMKEVLDCADRLTILRGGLCGGIYAAGRRQREKAGGGHVWERAAQPFQAEGRYLQLSKSTFSQTHPCYHPGRGRSHQPEGHRSGDLSGRDRRRSWRFGKRSKRAERPGAGDDPLPPR